MFQRLGLSLSREIVLAIFRQPLVVEGADPGGGHQEAQTSLMRLIMPDDEPEDCLVACGHWRSEALSYGSGHLSASSRGRLEADHFQRLSSVEIEEGFDFDIIDAIMASPQDAHVLEIVPGAE